MAKPLSEVVQSATIKYGDQSLEITCENKYKFYDIEDEEILPELKDGMQVTLNGEITRINKRSNDLGFNYRGKALSVSPLDTEKNIADYHKYLAADEVQITGLISRTSSFESPKIKIIEITTMSEDQLSFEFSAN